MKIEIGANEVIEFMNGGDATKLKEKLSGALLNIAATPEMTTTIDKMMGERVSKALDGAFKVGADWRGTVEMKGWAVAMVKEWATSQLGTITLESIVRSETKKSIDALAPKLLEEALKRINVQEITALLAKAMVDSNIKATVEAEVKQALQKMFGAVK
jgi:hypothetical protein